MKRTDIDNLFGAEATDENLIHMGEYWTLEDVQSYLDNTGYSGDAAEILAWLQKFANQTIEEMARGRVAEDEELLAYQDIIFYDWPNWADHLEWIAIAPRDEILKWAAEIRNNELLRG